MALEQTLSIIKPDAIAKRLIGKIYTRFEQASLTITSVKMCNLTPEQAADFYKEHASRSFFNALVNFMSSSPILVQVLEAQNATMRYRKLMGSTDPKQAASGTLRAEFGESLDRNAVHGSDQLATAQREIQFFFKTSEIFSR